MNTPELPPRPEQPTRPVGTRAQRRAALHELARQEKKIRRVIARLEKVTDARPE